MERRPSLMFVSLVGALLSLTARSALSFQGGWHVSRSLRPDSGWDGKFTQDSLLSNHLYRVYVFVDEWSDRDALDTNLNSMFSNAIQSGAKIILRFGYFHSEPDMDTIKDDISHFLPIIQKGKKALAAIQAGWLGKRGEWNKWSILPSDDDGTDPTIRDAKTYVVDAMKKVGVPVQLRYPIDKAVYYDDDPQINLHDNCLGVDDTDSGTYFRGSRSGVPWPVHDIKSAKSYLQSLPWNGAESCTGTGGVVPDCTTLLALVREDKIAYLNLDYPSQFRAYAESLDDRTCFEEITQVLEENGAN